MKSAILASGLLNGMQELAALRAKADSLQAEVDRERTAALRQLPAQFGFESPAAFVIAFNAAHAGNGTTARSAKPAARNGKLHVATTADGRPVRPSPRNCGRKSTIFSVRASRASRPSTNTASPSRPLRTSRRKRAWCRSGSNPKSLHKPLTKGWAARSSLSYL